MFNTVPQALQCTASALQAADRAGEAHLGGREQCLGEIQKKSHAEDHDDDGDQASDGAWQGDVAEAGRGQRGDREVERVGIVGDLVVV